MIAVVGLSHQHAPIEVREALALPEPDLPALLAELVAEPEIEEALVLSTCNRMEVLAAGAEPTEASSESAAQAATRVLLRRAPSLERHLRRHVGVAGVRHLLRVASSLDSLVVGEPQILGQVKQAFRLGLREGTVGRVLHRAFPHALATAKRVRTETALGAGQVSVPSVAVELARRIFGDLSGRAVVLVGSGEMAETTAGILRREGARAVVVGRNAARREALAHSLGGEALPMERMEEALVLADVVVSSTSAQSPVITRRALAGLRRARKGRALFLIDLAVPRDVEPAAGELEGVFLYNVDDLSGVVAEALSSRRKEAEAAERIVSEELASWQRWADGQSVAPALTALRSRVRGLLEREVQRSLSGRLRHLGESDREAITSMLDAFTNKLLHEPTSRLRRAAEDPEEQWRAEHWAEVLVELFALQPVEGASEGAKDALEHAPGGAALGEGATR